MAIPDYQTLMLPVLVLASEGEQRVSDITESIANHFGLTEAEREQLLPSGRQRILHNRIHWAKFYMSKAGLISSPARGRFVANEAGKALLATNPAKIDVTLLMREPTFREFYRNEAETDTTVKGGAVNAASELADATPEEQIEAAYQSVQLALRANLLERIMQNSPSFFEQLIVDLLVAMGYGGSHKNAAAQLGRSGDGGVDGVINEDRLGLDRVYVQAKRYAEGNTVGRPDIQVLLGALSVWAPAKGYSSPHQASANRLGTLFAISRSE